MEINEEVGVRLLWRLGAAEDREWLRRKCPEVVGLLSNTVFEAKTRDSGLRATLVEPLAEVQARVRNTLKAITEDLGESQWSGTPAEFLALMAKLGEVRSEASGPAVVARLGRALAQWGANDEVPLQFTRATNLPGCRRQWALTWIVNPSVVSPATHGEDHE